MGCNMKEKKHLKNYVKMLKYQIDYEISNISCNKHFERSGIISKIDLALLNELFEVHAFVNYSFNIMNKNEDVSKITKININKQYLIYSSYYDKLLNAAVKDIVNSKIIVYKIN